MPRASNVSTASVSWGEWNGRETAVEQLIYRPAEVVAAVERGQIETDLAGIVPPRGDGLLERLDRLGRRFDFIASANWPVERSKRPM